MIGITERGDAALDSSWMNKSNYMDGVILITKNPGAFINSEYEKFINKNKNKFIIHCSITGFGKTFIEPNVSPYTISCMIFITGDIVALVLPSTVLLRVLSLSLTF